VRGHANVNAMVAERRAREVVSHVCRSTVPADVVGYVMRVLRELEPGLDGAN
jgi:hypothetical protein